MTSQELYLRHHTNFSTKKIAFHFSFVWYKNYRATSNNFKIINDFLRDSFGAGPCTTQPILTAQPTPFT